MCVEAPAFGKFGAIRFFANFLKKIKETLVVHQGDQMSSL
jgi:hypothetical protein